MQHNCIAHRIIRWAPHLKRSSCQVANGRTSVLRVVAQARSTSGSRHYSPPTPLPRSSSPFRWRSFRPPPPAPLFAGPPNVPGELNKHNGSRAGHIVVGERPMKQRKCKCCLNAALAASGSGAAQRRIPSLPLPVRAYLSHLRCLTGGFGRARSRNLRYLRRSCSAAGSEEKFPKLLGTSLRMRRSCSRLSEYLSVCSMTSPASSSYPNVP